MRRDLAYPANIQAPPFTRRERVQIAVGVVVGTLAFFVGVGLLFAAGSVQ